MERGKLAGGIGHNIEDVDFFNGSAKHVGGSISERRVNRNYSKTEHAKHDAAAREVLQMPNVSMPRILPL